MDNNFDPVKKAPQQQVPQQYDFGMRVDGSGAGAASAGANDGGKNAAFGGTGSSYNIDLGGQGFGGGSSNYQQFPEAQPAPVDPNAPPAEGQPLYPPEEVAANPQLSRFVKTGFKDIWASILFVPFFLLPIIWGIVNMATYKLQTRHDSGSHHHGDDDDHHKAINDFSGRLGTAGAIIALIVSLGVSIVVASVCLLIAKMIPGKLIYVANIAIIAMYIGSGISFAIGGAYVGLVIMLILAALQALWLFLVRSRIPFSAALLKASTQVLGQNKGVYVANVLLAIFFFVYCIFWGFAMLAPVDKLAADRGGAGDGVLIGVFVFGFLWTAQVVTNLMHVTTSGVVATWYFAGSLNMPRFPTLSSFKRGITTSFGSICFGSLLVATIQFIRFLLESSRGDGDNNFVRCIVDCILRCLENLVEYFNTYAFVHVAVYGCGYIEAARRTFALCQQCFFAAYFNDCLVQPTLGMLGFVAAILIGVVFGLIAGSWVMFAWVFAMSWIVHALLFSAVSSAITTIFVCFAEVPEALQSSDPELYSKIHAADGGEVHSGNAPQPTV